MEEAERTHLLYLDMTEEAKILSDRDGFSPVFWIGCEGGYANWERSGRNLGICATGT